MQQRSPMVNVRIIQYIIVIDVHNHVCVYKLNVFKKFITSINNSPKERNTLKYQQKNKQFLKVNTKKN